MYIKEQRKRKRPFCGYSEIQTPRERYAILDHDGLRELLNFRSLDDLADACRRWIEEAVLTGDRRREGTWTERIAVGSESLVDATKEKVGIKAKDREVIGGGGRYVLKESPMPYKTLLWRENEDLRPQIGYDLERYCWNVSNLAWSGQADAAANAIHFPCHTGSPCPRRAFFHVLTKSTIKKHRRICHLTCASARSIF